MLAERQQRAIIGGSGCSITGFVESIAMGPLHYVRVGALGWVGRFAAEEPLQYPRGSRVVCRTRRGLELGEVLNSCHTDGPIDGSLLRRMTVEDHLVAERLRRRRNEAFTACQQLLRELRVPVVLVDVEQLFDGQTVYFYFLGEPNEKLAVLTNQLAELFAAKIQLAKFYESLVQGCGPGCGTDSRAQCSTACTSCALVSACRR